MQVIDKFGNDVVIPGELREITGFSKEGISPVRLQNGETAIIDKNGKVLFNTGYDVLTVFENGMSVFRDPVTDLRGVYTSNGQRVVKAEYHWISPFCDGYAIATQKTEHSILVLNRDGSIEAQIDKSGIAHDYLPPCEKLIPFRDTQTDLRGFIDFESNIAVPANYKQVSPFRDNLARVLISTGGGLKVGFINKHGSFVIEPHFIIDSELLAESTDFSEGIAFVPFSTSLRTKVAIDTNGDEIFRVDAYSIEPMVDGRAAFFDRIAQKWGFIDSKGSVIVKPIYDIVGNYGDGLAVVSQNP